MVAEIMHRTTSFCPYFAGTTLNVAIVHENNEEASENLEVSIVKCFEPFTLSCALLVELDWPSLNLRGQYVLKLFDRRFAAQLRQDHRAAPWTPELEGQYLHFVHSGDLSGHLAFIAEKESEDTWHSRVQSDWNQVRLEAYLQYCMRKYFLAESAVYDQLHDLQGQDIPRCYARVMMRTSPDELQAGDYLHFPGILLEYIQGFPLTDLDKFSPKATWQAIVDDAIRIVNRIGDANIRNDDVKTRSIMVQLNPHTAKYRVCMMDFGHCVLRRPDQDDDDWGYWKASEDEEGAIGVVMERRLPAGGYKYTQSDEALRLMNKYMSEDSPYCLIGKDTQIDSPTEKGEV